MHEQRQAAHDDRTGAGLVRPLDPAHGLQLHAVSTAQKEERLIGILGRPCEQTRQSRSWEKTG